MFLDSNLGIKVVIKAPKFKLTIKGMVLNSLRYFYDKKTLETVE